MILLKKLRIDKNLSQRNLHELANVPVDRIMKAEVYGVPPTPEQAKRLAEALDFTGDPADLFEQTTMASNDLVITCTFEPQLCDFTISEDGTYLKTDQPADDNGAFNCSACGYTMLDDWFYKDKHTNKIVPDFNYCPNCGRKVIS